MDSDGEDPVLKARMNLDFVVGQLQYLARAFSATGNDVLANKLITYAAMAEESGKALHKAYSDEINRSVNVAQQNTGTILAVLLMDKP